MQGGNGMSANGRVLSGRSILIVEDEPLIALEVHAAFSAAGASIVAAAHSSEAMQMINSPDLSAAVVDIDLGRGEDCDEEQDDAGDGGEAPRLLRAGAGEHGFDRLAAGFAQQGAELRRETAAHGIRPEEQPRHAGHDQHQRPHREHRVVGKRGAQPRAPMPEPLVNRGLKDFQDHRKRTCGGVSQEELRRGRGVSAADVSSISSVEVVRSAKSRGRSVATVESCTAGALACLLAATEDAGDVFHARGFVVCVRQVCGCRRAARTHRKAHIRQPRRGSGDGAGRAVTRSSRCRGGGDRRCRP